MPVPDEILKNRFTYEPVWSGALRVTGRNGSFKMRTFYSYVEVMEQGAHDTTIRSVWLSRGGKERPMHEGLVEPANTDTRLPFEYYRPLGRQAAEITSNWMTERWAAQKVEEAEQKVKEAAKKAEAQKRHRKYVDETTFAPALTSEATKISVQKKRQDNRFSFEITMWYQVSEIYLAFHCYKNNRL